MPSAPGRAKAAPGPRTSARWNCDDQPPLLPAAPFSTILRTFFRLPAVRRDPPRGHDGGAVMPQDERQDQPLDVVPSATTLEPQA